MVLLEVPGDLRRRKIFRIDAGNHDAGARVVVVANLQPDRLDVSLVDIHAQEGFGLVGSGHGSVNLVPAR